MFYTIDVLVQQANKRFDVAIDRIRYPYPLFPIAA